MTRTLRHANALTDHRELERLDQSLVQSVVELVASTGGRSPSPAAPRSLGARLWRAEGPSQCPALILSAQVLADTRSLASPSGGGTAGGGTAGEEAHRTLHARQPQSRLCAEAGAELRCRTWIPIHRRETPLGVLEIDSPAPLSTSRLTLVQGMCGLYANHLSLLHESQIDTLTQLLNRKTFDDTIQRLLSHPTGGAAPTWAAVVDIDHFKRINDGYGHLFGDEVLILVSRLMRQAFRQQDKVFRFGGEEFVVLLQSLDEDGALAALERLRSTLESHPFPQVGRVTVSIGATAIQGSDAACDALGRADAALYHAKAHGRNQVCLFEQLKAQGEVAPSVTLHGDVDLF